MPEPLRPKSVPAPVPSLGAIPADQLPGEGRLPMRTGEVRVSDYTRRQLQAAGWKDGDPIPGDLGQRLQEIQAEVLAERDAAKIEDSPLAAGWKPINSSFVSIENLPPEKQAEVREYLAEYKAQVAKDKQEAQMVADVEARIPDTIQGPTRGVMRDAILQGEAASAAREYSSNVIDDRVPAPPVAVPEGKVYAGMIGNTDLASKIEALKQQANTPVKPTPLPVEEPPSSTKEMHVACPRCSWPTDKAFELPIDEQDKQLFIMSIIGTSRFEKKYDLLGGQAQVYFRSLTTAEVTLLSHQLGAMVRSGEIIGDGEYWTHLLEYRLVMSLSQISTGGNVIYKVAPILEWAKDNPPTDPSQPVQVTPIGRLRDYLYAEGLTQEPFRRIVNRVFQQFQRLVEALEALTNSENF